MLGISDYWAFVAAVAVFLVLPGPGTLALLASAGKGGVRGGVAATLGLIVGDQVLLWLAVAGVAAILQGHPLLFKAVQYAGAAYLVIIGLRLALGSGAALRPVPIHGRHFFRQALLITLLNPKAIVFYMAFFPLFIDPATQRGFVTFGAMALTIAGLAFAYGLLLAVLAHAVTARVKTHRSLLRVLERLAGTVLVAFGIRLAQ
jgi:threonine/homoserine/homoserine lactone efflux protein